MKGLIRQLSVPGIVTIISTTLLLAGCGGGGSDGPSGPELSTGVFVDAPVIGLAYSQGARSGSTNSDGEFSFDPQDGYITFSLGSVTIGTVPGASRVTPYDFGENDTPVNIAQFIQSMDPGWDGQGAIDVTAAADLLHSHQLDFTLPEAEFVPALTSVTTELEDYEIVDRGDAKTALEEGTKDTFDLADIANRAFYYQIGDSTAFADRGIITFVDDEGEHFGGLDALSDIEANGGDGYGVEFTWDIVDGRVELYIDDVIEDRDIITRLSAVSVDGATRYLVEYDPYDVSGYIVASMMANIKFDDPAKLVGNWDITLEDDTPFVLHFSDTTSGDLGGRTFTWEISPLGAVEMNFGDIGGGFDEIIYLARFGGDDTEFFGVYISAEVDRDEEDPRPSFFSDGMSLTATKQLL